MAKQCATNASQILAGSITLSIFFPLGPFAFVLALFFFFSLHLIPLENGVLWGSILNGPCLQSPAVEWLMQAICLDFSAW
jgi:hypothetical protein